MWGISGILVAAAIIICIELPSLRKKKQKKEMWIFSLFLLIGTGLSIALSAGVLLPNPLDWILVIYKPVSDVIFSYLK